jgi:hypothetical protein
MCAPQSFYPGQAATSAAHESPAPRVFRERRRLDRRDLPLHKMTWLADSLRKVSLLIDLPYLGLRTRTAT